VGGLEAEDPAIPAPSSSTPLPSEATARGLLAQRRRRTARRVAAILAILLVACWWVLRADTRPLLATGSHDLTGWLAAAVDAPRALFARSADEPVAPSGARHAPAPRLAVARLAQGPTASRSAELPASTTAAPAQSTAAETARTARSQPAPRPPTTPPAAEPAAPSDPLGEESAPPAVEVDAEPVVGDVLVDLSPGDFEGSLGSAVSVGGAGAGIDLQLQEGAVAVDTSLRVDLPEVAGVAGPTAAAAQLQLAPGELATGVTLGTGGAGAGVQLQAAPGQLGSAVELDVAGLPAALAAAADSEGLAIDLSTGGLVPTVLGGDQNELSSQELLPIDLPIDLRLR